MEVEFILNRVQNGHTQDFNHIVDIYQKQLFNYIYCILNNRQDAEDVLQETFVVAFQRLYQYRSGTSFSAWLYRIAKNLSLNAIKKRNRVLPTPGDTLERLIDQHPLYEIFPVGDERIGLVWKQLNFEEKNILLLRIHQEKSYEEIGLILNKGQDAIRKKYERARKKFIKFYEALNQEDVVYGNRETIKNVF